MVGTRRVADVSHSDVGHRQQVQSGLKEREVRERKQNLKSRRVIRKCKWSQRARKESVLLGAEKRN